MDRVVVVVTWGRGEGYRYYNGIIDAWQNTRVEVVHLSLLFFAFNCHELRL